jgi:hypothetical protein
VVFQHPLTVGLAQLLPKLRALMRWQPVRLRHRAGRVGRTQDERNGRKDGGDGDSLHGTGF